ncbi:hypothetical protein RRG08_028608 [Elysia crispata]|uniref:Secreted protein n=1 Tax=Elysia crispata TaxID=231223 RepID=A0AAE0ZT72_9GAST|nr:hypothetical protein RRG08_028608 [Elysia crispata]
MVAHFFLPLLIHVTSQNARPTGNPRCAWRKLQVCWEWNRRLNDGRACVKRRGFVSRLFRTRQLEPLGNKIQQYLPRT